MRKEEKEGERAGRRMDGVTSKLVGGEDACLHFFLGFGFCFVCSFLFFPCHTLRYCF